LDVELGLIETVGVEEDEADADETSGFESGERGLGF
jgi:hypothetical protein